MNTALPVAEVRELTLAEFIICQLNTPELVIETLSQFAELYSSATSTGNGKGQQSAMGLG
ncbi:hypothetical protein SAMN02745866_02154 [Alteromonadaceae bacterium Bs31]|nr:hypothetical protein SAMN02745866_02154 [Alteromonadaceae bacterium Bs31]